MIYVEQFLRCGWNPENGIDFPTSCWLLISIKVCECIVTHTSGRSLDLIQAWVGPSAFHGSWLPDTLSSRSVSSAVQLNKSGGTDTKQDCGWKWWGRAMMGGMTLVDRKEENLGMWHRTETEAWEGGGRQSSRQRGWSVLFLCLGFKSLGTKLFPSQSLSSEIPKHLRGSRERLDCDSRVQNRH